MSFFERVKKDVVVSALAYIAIGVVLLFFPGVASITLVHMIALVAGIAGVVAIIVYFARGQASAGSGGLISGIIYLIAAAVIYFAAPFIVSFIPIIFGIMILVSGVIKLQQAMDLMKYKADHWLAVLVVSILSIALGILALVNPFGTAELLLRIIGISLVYSGVSDLLTVFYFSKKTKF